MERFLFSVAGKPKSSEYDALIERLLAAPKLPKPIKATLEYFLAVSEEGFYPSEAYLLQHYEDPGIRVHSDAELVYHVRSLVDAQQLQDATEGLLKTVNNSSTLTELREGLNAITQLTSSEAEEGLDSFMPITYSDVLARPQEAGINTGVIEIDTLTNGFQRGSVGSICGFTGQGKCMALRHTINTLEFGRVDGNVLRSIFEAGEDFTPIQGLHVEQSDGSFAEVSDLYYASDVPVVTLSHEWGGDFTCTPHHPILALRNGESVPRLLHASELRQGDYLLRRKPIPNQMPRINMDAFAFALHHRSLYKDYFVDEFAPFDDTYWWTGFTMGLLKSKGVRISESTYDRSRLVIILPDRFWRGVVLETLDSLGAIYKVTEHLSTLQLEFHESFLDTYEGEMATTRDILLGERVDFVRGCSFCYLWDAPIQEQTSLLDAIPYLMDEDSSFDDPWVYGGFVYSPITDVTEGTADVYDVTVPSTHLFVCDGLICHNTQMWLSVIFNNALKGVKCVYLSLEVAPSLVWLMLEARYMSQVKGIDVGSHELTSRSLTGSRLEQVKEAEADFLKDIGENLLVVDSTTFPLITATSSAAIRALYSSFESKLNGLDMVVYDHVNQIEKLYPEKGNIILKQITDACVTWRSKDDKSMFTGWAVQCNREGYKRAQRNNGEYDLVAIADLNEVERSSSYCVFVFHDDLLRSENKIAVSFKKHRYGDVLYGTAQTNFRPEISTVGDNIEHVSHEGSFDIGSGGSDFTNADFGDF